MKTRKERAQEFAQIWYQSRIDAGFSQEALALELGVSKKTIQNWERGITAPDMFQGQEWFRVIGRNPMKYYLAYHHPTLFPHDQSNESNTKDVLLQYLEQAKESNRAKLLWLVEGRKEYVWNGMLQMMMMHSVLSLEARAVTAQALLDIYEIEKEARNIQLPEQLQPDVELLKDAIKKAKEAAKKNKTTIDRR